MFYWRTLFFYQRYRSGSDIRIELVVFQKKLRSQIRTRDGGKITIDEEVCDSLPNSRKPCEAVVPDVKCLERKLQYFFPKSVEEIYTYIVQIWKRADFIIIEF